MTPKQKLMLFFIHTGFADTQYALIKHFDRWNFPAELGFNLQPLLNENIIIVSKLDSYGNAFGYSVTEKGKMILFENDFYDDILNYITTLPNARFLLEITEALIKKENEE